MTPSFQRSRTVGLLSALALALGVLLAGPASAAPDPTAAPDASSGAGWVRLAHYSPDTPAVDVSLTALDGGQTMTSLQDIAYGSISAYQRVPAGTYAASMAQAGAPVGSTPIVDQAFTVTAGRAYTVAAVGLNAQLSGVVLTDDLTPPTDGRSRIRVVQASVSSGSVTVEAAGGPVITRNATLGTASAYASIDPGVWTVELTGSTGSPVTTQVTVEPGTVNTLTVLDRDSSLSIEATVDASAVGAVAPAGGVQTGGGSTADRVIGTDLDRRGALPVILAWCASVAVVVGIALPRRRARTAQL